MRRLAVLVVLAALVAPSHAHAVLPQDDAGSGRDAPNAADPFFRIDPGQTYTGTIEGAGLDEEDWYAFVAPRGATIEGRSSGALGCLRIFDTSGEELDAACTAGMVELSRASAVAPSTGTYYLQYSYLEAHAYAFSLNLNSPAPSPLPVDTDPLASGGVKRAAVAPATQGGKHVVVAVVDTGINPYHEFFRAPALQSHPRTWLPGFPKSAVPVRLSLGAATWKEAAADDADTFAALDRSTYDAKLAEFDEHLYTFPGTRVVAGISFGEYEDTGFPAADPQPVRDDYGHGTHSAGLAAGANLSSPDGNVLIVAVEVGKSTFEEGILWAARQPWIDAISISLGYVANAPVTTSPLGNRTGPDWMTREASAAGKPVFVASGNGFSNTGVTPDHCSTYTSAYTGPAWVARIGAAEPSDGSPTWWHCVPVEAVARTNVSSPAYDDLATMTSASGTSAATPNAAGHWARLMLETRRAGLTVKRKTVLQYLLHAAAPVEASAGAHDPSAYPLSLADQGYGLIDDAAVDAALARLVVRDSATPRPETETWFAQDHAIRVRIWGPDVD
jgi:hypothetical protein